MDGVRQYFLKMICAALITAIAAAFSDKKSGMGVVARIIGTSFLLLIAIDPLIRFDYRNLRSYWDDVATTTESSTQSGIQLQKDAAGEIIKQKTASYILDKASQFHADLQVEVYLADDNFQSPACVEIQGSISPYGRSWLQTAISEDLGIPEEKQKWIG